MAFATRVRPSCWRTACPRRSPRSDSVTRTRRSFSTSTATSRRRCNARRPKRSARRSSEAGELTSLSHGVLRVLQPRLDLAFVEADQIAPLDEGDSPRSDQPAHVTYADTEAMRDRRDVDECRKAQLFCRIVASWFAAWPIVCWLLVLLGHSYHLESAEEDSRSVGWSDLRDVFGLDSLEQLIHRGTGSRRRSG